MIKREATYFTPDLVLTNNKLSISGKLWMENPPLYFEEIFAVTKDKIRGDFEVIIEVDHLNSSSIKQFVLYFKLLKELKKVGQISSISIAWKVDADDEDHISMVGDIAWITGINIQIIKQSISSGK